MVLEQVTTQFLVKLIELQCQLMLAALCQDRICQNPQCFVTLSSPDPLPTHSLEEPHQTPRRDAPVELPEPATRIETQDLPSDPLTLHQIHRH